MNIDTLKKTNTKKLTINSFLFIGAMTIGLMAKDDMLISMSLLITPFVYRQASIRKKINNKDYSSKIFNKDVIFSELSNDYVMDFSKNFIKYVENSNTELEKKFKIVFSILWLKKTGSFKNILNNLSVNKSKEKVLIDKYKEIFKEVKLEQYLKKDFQEIDLKVLSEKLPSNISEEDYAIIKKIFADFKDFGFLGENILDISRPLVQLMFKLQEYKLNDNDIEALKKEKFVISEDQNIRYTLEKLLKQVGKDQLHIETMEKIVMANNKDTLDVLINFYSKLNNDKSFNETINIIETSFYKKELEKSLPKKSNKTIPNKVKKI